MFSRLFRVQDFLHIFIIVEVRAVRRIMTLTALVLINLGQVFPWVGVAFSGSVAGLTLDIFISAAGVFRGAESGGVTGQTGLVGGFLFFDQCLVGPGVRGCCPMFVLARMTGGATLFPEE